MESVVNFTVEGETDGDVESNVRTLTIDTMPLPGESDFFLDDDRPGEDIRVKVLGYDQQYGPRVVIESEQTITIRPYDDVEVVTQRQIEQLQDAEALINDDVIPFDLVENEYFRMSRKALATWTKYAETVLLVTEALAIHRINQEQVAVSGKSLIVPGKDHVVALLQQQIDVWKDFSQRFEEHRFGLEENLEEAKRDLHHGLTDLKTMRDTAKGQVISEVEDKIILELAHAVRLFELKLKNIGHYRSSLSDNYQKTCKVFSKFVHAEMRTFQKALANIKRVTAPILRQVEGLRKREADFCAKERAALEVLMDLVRRKLLPHAPSWFEDWFGGVSLPPLPPSREAVGECLIDQLSNELHIFSAQVGFWLHEFPLSSDNGRRGTGGKGRGAGDLAPSPAACFQRLKAIQKTIVEAEMAIELGGNSLMPFWGDEGADAAPLLAAVQKLASVMDELERERESAHKQCVGALEQIQSDQLSRDSLQDAFDCIQHKMGLLSVTEYAVKQSGASIRAKLVKTVHAASSKATEAIRAMKMQLRTRMENKIRELRTLTHRDATTQVSICEQFEAVNTLATTLQQETDFLNLVTHTRTLIKQQFALQSVQQDLAFVDSVRQSAQSELDSLLAKFQVL